MKYNFDDVVDRRNTASLKWNVEKNELPMWVADMDFKAPDFIVNKLVETSNFANFGYQNIPDSYYASFVNWWEKRHNFKMDKEWLIFATGVVPAISSIIRKVTTPGEKVLVQEPDYNMFFNSIVNNGRFIVSNDLVYKNQKYSIDFTDLEKKLSDPQVTLMILCNPHNPVGRIWSIEELTKIGELCKKYNVIVLSDEIHCDLVEPGFEYIPFASVNDVNKNNSITCMSATKCFSIPGLQGACVSVANSVLRYKVWRGLNTDDVAEANSFVCGAVSEAFDKGEDWVNELNEYINTNKNYVKKFLKDNIKEFKLTESHALYLIWVNIKGLTNDSKEFCDFLRKETGLFITNGKAYGKSGDGFVRINLATSLDYVKDGMNRLLKGVNLFKNR